MVRWLTSPLSHRKFLILPTELRWILTTLLSNHIEASTHVLDAASVDHGTLYFFASARHRKIRGL
jgi:hypothetical protein